MKTSPNRGNKESVKNLEYGASAALFGFSTWSLVIEPEAFESCARARRSERFEPRDPQMLTTTSGTLSLTREGGRETTSRKTISTSVALVRRRRRRGWTTKTSSLE
jgi:hypothetical protein